MTPENHPNVPPFYRPVWYTYQKEEERRRQAQKTAQRDWRNRAILQGLFALGWVALGRYAGDHGNGLLFALSIAGVKGTVEKQTQALSNYLTLRRQTRSQK